MAQKVMYPGMVNSPETTITNGISESDTIIYVLDPTRVPTPPNLMTLGTGTNAETVKVTEINDSAITVERGFQGIAKSWPAGTVIARNFTAYDYDALRENIEDLDASKETPAGAQAKADAAESAAKTYAVSILDAHKSDYMLQIPYAIATGSANNYSVLLNGVDSYYEGMAIAVKINVDNTGASTINVNGLGAKAIKKPNGSDVAAGNLKAGSIYSMRYNGINFILQGSDAAGNATPGDVLSGKTFSSDQGTNLVGTMPNRTGYVTAQSISVSETTLRFRPQSGYYPGDSGNAVQYSDANFVAGNIKNGISIFGINGTLLGVTNDVVYSKGTERILMVAGISSGTGSRSKESDHLYIYVNNAGDYAYVTDTLIDLTNVTEVIVLWEGGGTASGRSAYCNISTSKTGDRSTYNASVGKSGTFPKTISRIDTSALSGNYYIRVHSRTNTAGTSIVKVYRLILIYQI